MKTQFHDRHVKMATSWNKEADLLVSSVKEKEQHEGHALRRMAGRLLETLGVPQVDGELQEWRNQPR